MGAISMNNPREKQSLETQEYYNNFPNEVDDTLTSEEIAELEQNLAPYRREDGTYDWDGIAKHSTPVDEDDEFYPELNSLDENG
jgi:hypothetical protein